MTIASQTANQIGSQIPDEARPVMRRLGREEAYMEMAKITAKRGTCPRAYVGCVAVVDNHVVATGYNGAPPNMDHCVDVGCGGGVAAPEGGLFFPNGCTRSTHAELNMVAFAARHGIALAGSTVYTTVEPCLACAKALISAGIECLVYLDAYRIHDGLALLDKATVEIVKYGQ